MYYKKACLALIAFTIFYSIADAKKTRKTKRPSNDIEESTPQPKVISYSTFGFNDVGSYNGFEPSSSDYANYNNIVNQESTTRLYAPAFPTALESIGYDNNNYETQSVQVQAYNSDEDKGQHSSVLQYPQNIKHFLDSSNQDIDNIIINNQESSGRNEDNINYPAYGDKLSYRDKNKSNQFNNTETNIFSNSGYSSPSDNKYFNLPETHTTYDNRPKYGESNFNYENVPTNVATYMPTDVENLIKPLTDNTHSLFNYPRMVGFTKMMQIHYPSATQNFETTTLSTVSNENFYGNTYADYYNKPPKYLSSSDDIKNSENNDGLTKNNFHTPNAYDSQGYSYIYSTSHDKNITTEVKPSSEYKKKSRNKKWIQNKNHTNNFNNWKDASSLIVNEYFPNDYKPVVNIDSKIKTDSTKVNFDRVVSDSNNLINVGKYQFSDIDYTNFKKMPELPYDNYYNSITSTKTSPHDNLNPYKHLTDTTSTATSYWGNIFKPHDYLPYQAPLNKYTYDEEKEEEVISITKRPNKYSINRPTGIKSTDWAYGNDIRYKQSLPAKDWSNELLNRYKSEEDLLSLRNHDTSHSSYLPVQKPSHERVTEVEYKNILEKWKQSYLKTKYKNSLLRDYESIGTEADPLHVPIPNPYPIEIPHPVIVPVPQPYPVRIPIAKPVAVPVLRELTVTIVKPVPYPVYKKVPYPIEKPVPVTVEKEVTVPIVKPYPVHVPYVRPVFHHTKPVNDDSDNVEDDDYMPRPESSKKNVHYRRKPHSSHNRIRRPNRGSYQDRNRRYSPNRHRHTASAVDSRYNGPYGEDVQAVPYKYEERDNERLKEDHSAFMLYCKKRGIC